MSNKMPFTFQFTESEGIAVVALFGNLVEGNEANGLSRELEWHLDKGIKYFIFDLSNLNYINSMGLNVLIRLLTRSRNSAGDLMLAGLSEKIEALFVVTKLSSIFRVYNSVEEARKNIIASLETNN